VAIERREAPSTPRHLGEGQGGERGEKRKEKRRTGEGRRRTRSTPFKIHRKNIFATEL
jgi:hypothetical protein